MTRPEQKDEELATARLYQSACGLLGRLEPADPPDFILHAPDKRIAIEVIGYHQHKYPGDRFNRTAYESSWEELREKVVEYREKNAGLENLCVSLEFTSIEVPSRKHYGKFIQAIHREIEKVKHGLTTKQTRIQMNEGHAPLLRQFLKAINVRMATGYREWQSPQHSSGWVGTSEDELLRHLSGKLSKQRLTGFDEVHLVLDGGGPAVGMHIGMILIEWLTSWAKLNRALSESAYDVVAIMDYRKLFTWTKDNGWIAKPLKSAAP